MRKVSKKSSAKKTQQVLVARDMVPERLPALSDQLATSITLRFQTSTVFTGLFVVTAQNLLDAWFVAGTATNAYQLFDFVRVRRVTIRGMGRDSVTGGAALPPMATVGVEYFGITAGSSTGGKQKSDTSLGYNVPALVSLAPDPKSQAAQWQPSSVASLFAVRASDQQFTPIAGAVIDVEVSYRNAADVGASAVGVARAGLSPGNLYFGGLDGQPLATSAAPSVFVLRA